MSASFLSALVYVAMTTIAFVNAHTSSYMCRVHLRINIASFINVDVFKRFDYFFT